MCAAARGNIQVDGKEHSWKSQTEKVWERCSVALWVIWVYLDWVWRPLHTNNASQQGGLDPGPEDLNWFPLQLQTDLNILLSLWETSQLDLNYKPTLLSFFFFLFAVPLKTELYPLWKTTLHFIHQTFSALWPSSRSPRLLYTTDWFIMWPEISAYANFQFYLRSCFRSQQLNSLKWSFFFLSLLFHLTDYLVFQHILSFPV